MICRQCGAVLHEDDNFCMYCGAPTGLADVPPVKPAAVMGHLNFTKLLGDTFTLYVRNFGTFCLAGLLLVLVPGFFNILDHCASNYAKTAEAGEYALPLSLTSVLLNMIEFVFQAYFLLGVLRQSLYIARGGSGFQPRLMFPPLMPGLKMMGLFFIFSLIVFTVVFLGVFVSVFSAIFCVRLIGGGNVMYAGLCGILLATPFLFLGLWIGTRTCLAPVFLADQEIGITDSFRYAWRLSSMNFWRLLLVSIVLFFFAIIGLIVLLVGIVMTICIYNFGLVLAYLQLTGQPNCLDELPGEFSSPTSPDVNVVEP